MSYYTKEQLRLIILEKHTYCIENEIPIFVSMEKSYAQIATEEDVVSFFWFEFPAELEMDGSGVQKVVNNPKLKSIMAARVDYDLYCDDRVAIDMVFAQKENKTLKEFIKEKRNSIQETKKSLGVDIKVITENIQKLHEKLNKPKDNGS